MNSNITWKLILFCLAISFFSFRAVTIIMTFFISPQDINMTSFLIKSAQIIFYLTTNMVLVFYSLFIVIKHGILAGIKASMEEGE